MCGFKLILEFVGITHLIQTQNVDTRNKRTKKHNLINLNKIKKQMELKQSMNFFCDDRENR